MGWPTTECPACNGEGEEPHTYIGATGVVYRAPMTCATCKGSGQVPDPTCEEEE